VWCDRFFRSTDRVGHRNLTRLADHPAEALSGYIAQAVGYYNPANDVHHVIYPGHERHLHELWWVGNSRPQYGGDLNALASQPVGAASLGSAFINPRGENIIFYRGLNGHIYSLYWNEGAGPVGSDDLSGGAGTPTAKSYSFYPDYSPDPVGFYTANHDIHQVVYRAQDDHLYVLWWEGNAQVVGWDITDRTRAPHATYSVCNFTAYPSASGNVNHIIYVTSDFRLHDIVFDPRVLGGLYFDLTAKYGAPPARGRPAAFTMGGNTQHIVYRGAYDNHIYEIICSEFHQD
jgi:hypothetical protein